MTLGFWPSDMYCPPMREKKSDPTKDAEFQGVVQHFLKTPPQPHTPKGKKKASPAKGKAKKLKA